MERAEFIFVGFEARELHEVALLEKIRQTYLLRRGKPGRLLEIEHELFGGAFGGFEVKAFLQIDAQGAGDGNAKQTGIMDQGERLAEFLFRSNVRRHYDERRRWKQLASESFPSQENRQR